MTSPIEERLGIYVIEVQNQVEAARLSIDAFNSAMRQKVTAAGPRPRENAVLFLTLQGILTAAASISKLLWPAPALRTRDGDPLPEDQEERRQLTLARGRALRSALRAKDLQILQNRAVRNGLEHFDERLDAYLAQHPNVVDRSVGSINAVISGDAPAAVLRHLDTDRGVLVVLDDEVVVQDLIDAMLLLEQRAERWLQRPTGAVSGSG